MIDKRIGERIKILRIEKGFNQDEIAEKLNISRSAYQRIESGESKTWAAKLIELCTILNVEPDDLIQYDKIIVNNGQHGGESHNSIITKNNNLEIVKNIYEARIEEYKERLKEKNDTIELLQNMLKSKI